MKRTYRGKKNRRKPIRCNRPKWRKKGKKIKGKEWEEVK